MKHVFDTDMVAHIWANQSQEDARNPQGNFYFRGDTIFSYRDSFPVARIIKRKGRECILITNDTYSSTTSRHCWLVRRAVSGKPVFTVPNRTLAPGRYYDYKAHEWQDSRSPHDANLNWYKHQVEEGIQKLIKGRDKDRHLTALEYSVNEANEYCEFFGLKRRFEVPANVDKESLREMGKEFRRKQEKKREQDHARHERQQAELLAKRQADKSDWLQGADVCYRNGWSEPTLLRIKGEVLETSQGAEVPLDHAKRAFKFIAECRTRNVEYQRNGHSIHVGHFKIDSIDAEGNIKAGCHSIQWSEIERIAEQLGLLNKEQEVLSNGQT
jgi:hypothetical protein